MKISICIQYITFCIIDVWVHIVFDEDAYDIIAPHLAGVAERSPAAVILDVDISAFTEQQVDRLAARLLLLINTQHNYL